MLKTRLSYFVSHPIQYQAPLLRKIASDPSIELTVIFEKDFSTKPYFDDGFQSKIDWGVPLLEGYSSSFFSEIRLVDQVEFSDVIWLHGWNSSGLRRVLKLADKAHKPVLMRGENWAGAMPDGSGLRRFAKNRYLKHIFKRCTAFLVIGSKNREYYRNHGIKGEQLFDMPYAIDNHYFAKSVDNQEISKLRRSLGVQNGEKIILFAGKLLRRKNPHKILSVWKRMKGRSPMSTRLLFVGDGEMRKELEREAPDNVIFAGFKDQTELPIYYAAADLFILMSEREPWGLAINEAMACGTPVVASDQCGAAYDLVDFNTGRMVKVDDEEGLSQAITDVLSNSETMGKAASKKIASWNFEADLIGLKTALGSLS